MTDHTPTTGEQYVPTISEIRADYIRGHVRHFDAYQVGRSLTSEQESWGEAFDQAIAAHDRKIAAEALRDAAREMRGDGKRVLIDAEESADWLDNYADGFEQGGES